MIARMAIHATPGLIFSAPLGMGDAGTEQTISMMRQLVDDAWKDPYVNRTAIDVIRNSGAPAYDTASQVRAIWEFANSFYFVNDPITKEALRPTRELLKLMAGDCDDINGNIIPALIGSIGLEPRLVTIKSDPQAPHLFSHVYAEVLLDGEWLPLDAARPNAVFGVAPKYFYERKWWSLVDGSSGNYPGEATNTSMAGYARTGVRGLAGLGSSFGTPSYAPGAAAQSIDGNYVQPAIQGATGPGGARFVSQPSAAQIEETNLTDLLILLGAGALIWALVK